MRLIQKKILQFIENEDISKEDFQNFIYFLKQQKINENKDEFREIIHLLLNIYQHHHPKTNIYEKIEQILVNFKNELQEKYSNYELFNIFCKNKLILLFLFQEKIIVPNQSIASMISNVKYLEHFYPHYFYPEMSLFLDKQLLNDISQINKQNNYNHDEFQSLRKKGQNESYLCQLIQNDSINDFITYVNKSNVSISEMVIEPSIFETNSILLKNRPRLIEYSAFYGSIQIFKYLFLQKVELTSSLWIYAIHSQNADLIYFLEDKQIAPPENSYRFCFIESLKCHHMDFSRYIESNLMPNQPEKDEQNKVFFKSIQYHNYIFIPRNIEINNDVFYHLCKYDYSI